MFIKNNYEKNEHIFSALESKKSEVRDDYEYARGWVWETDFTNTCNVHAKLNGYGIRDKEHWDVIIDFVADNIFKLKTVFDPLLDDIMRNVKTNSR